MNPSAQAPSSRRSRWARRAVLGCAAALLFGACSGDNSTAPLPPPGPNDLQLGGSLDCDGLLTVQFSLAWILRPPGTCYGVPDCGSIRLNVLFGDGTPPLEVTASASPVLVDLRAYGPATRQSLIGRTDALAAVLIDDANNSIGLVDGSTATGSIALHCEDSGIGAAGAAGAAGSPDDDGGPLDGGGSGGGGGLDDAGANGGEAGV